jgi:hypothetical protein
VVIRQMLNSNRNERIQNRLIRLQHEHEWVMRLNAEREQVLKLARTLHLVAGCLKPTPSNGDELHWNELRDTVYELHERLRIVDMAAYSGSYDQWFPRLEDYVEGVLQAVVADGDFKTTYLLEGQRPTLATRETLKGLDDRCNPIGIFLEVETAIRMEFSQFKDKWDAVLAS